MSYLGYKAVRVRVLVPLTLTFLVLISVFVFSSYKIRQSVMSHALEHRAQGVQGLYHEMIRQRTDFLISSVKFFVNQPRLARLMQDGDRKALYRETLPLFTELKSGHGVTHLYFHDPDGLNFLRVHKSEKFGDRIDRTTFDMARRSGQIGHGVELGVLGTYTLRIVIPWIIDNRLIGYVELGEEIESVLKNLRQITEADFLIAIDKQFLDREQWEMGVDMLGRTPDWDLIDSKVVIIQTIESMPHALEKMLKWEYSDREHAHRQGKAKRDYQIKSFPLMNATGKNIGDFVFLLDISKQRAEFFNFMLRTIFPSVLICLALFTFAFRILGRVDRDLVETREQLIGQFDKASEINQKLEKENLERKRAEAELKLLNDELESRVVDRTQRLEKLNREVEANRRELETAYEDLKAQQTTILHQDKMAGIGQLAAGVAHDINNPIGFVTSNLYELEGYIRELCQFIEIQTLVINSAGVSPEALEGLAGARQDLNVDYILEDLDDIVKESLEGAQRVSKIVRNLRSFSRLDNNDIEQANLEECLDSTISITANELRYKAEVVRDYGKIPPLTCFPGQLNQVFMNLLINAAQSMQEYGTITVKTWREDDCACVSIADTGSGIAESCGDRVFEPFFTTKPVGTGTGLGLSISYDIVKQHGGNISVESETGKGTTFVIKLPYKNGFNV